MARGVAEDVLTTESAAQRHRDLVEGALLAGVAVHLVDDSAAKDLCDTVTPAGIVAVCRIPAADPESLTRASLVVVAVDIAEPGNAGTMIRTADAMGADAMVLAGRGVDPYNGKCLRSSAGSIFGLPVITDTDVSGLLGRLRAAGLLILAATVDGELSLDDAGPLLGRPTAWVFGPEARGLPAGVAESADHRVSIPISGSAESLNVAAAAAICLYQSARTRRNPLG